MWIAIGIGSVLVLLAIVLLIVCCQRKKSAQSKRVAFKSTRGSYSNYEDYSPDRRQEDGRSPQRSMEFEMSPTHSFRKQPYHFDPRDSGGGAPPSTSLRQPVSHRTAAAVHLDQKDQVYSSYDHHASQRHLPQTAPTFLDDVSIDGFESPTVARQGGHSPFGSPYTSPLTSPRATTHSAGTSLASSPRNNISTEAPSSMLVDDTTSYLRFYHENAQRLEGYFKQINRPRFIKKIPKILLRNRGKEQKLFEMLVQKYGGSLQLSPRAAYRQSMATSPSRFEAL